MKKTITLIIALHLLLSFSSALAETKTFIKEYTYQASDFDSKMSSRTIALEQVKRLLLEEVGTYLISETDVKDFQLTKDRITTLTAGIVQAEILTQKWDGRTYYLKAKMSIAPQDVTRFLEGLRENSKENREYGRNELITGRQAVQSYRIVALDIVEMVKNNRLQPYSAYGEPIEASFQYEITSRVERLTTAKERILKADSESPLGNLNCEMRRKRLSDIENEMEFLVRKNSRSWEDIYVPEEQTEKNLLFPRCFHTATSQKT